MLVFCSVAFTTRTVFRRAIRRFRNYLQILLFVKKNNYFDIIHNCGGVLLVRLRYRRTQRRAQIENIFRSKTDVTFRQNIAGRRTISQSCLLNQPRPTKYTCLSLYVRSRENDYYFKTYQRAARTTLLFQWTTFILRAFYGCQSTFKSHRTTDTHIHYLFYKTLYDFKMTYSFQIRKRLVKYYTIKWYDRETAGDRE